MQAPFYILGRDSPKGRTGQDRLSPRSTCLTYTSGPCCYWKPFFAYAVASRRNVGDDPQVNTTAVAQDRAHHSRDRQPAVPRRFLSCFACYLPVSRRFPVTSSKRKRRITHRNPPPGV